MVENGIENKESLDWKPPGRSAKIFVGQLSSSMDCTKRFVKMRKCAPTIIGFFIVNFSEMADIKDLIHTSVSVFKRKSL